MSKLEHGFLFVFAAATALSLMWLAIIFSRACLRQIGHVHQQGRTADALVQLNRTLRVIADQGDRVEVAEVQTFRAGADLKAGQPVRIIDGVAYPTEQAFATQADMVASKVAAAQANSTGQRDA